jgi:Regulator of chromosome condensation (RCC1) repeat/PASTA domain
VTCWGSDGLAAGPHPPMDVPGLSSGVSAIATGGQHTCALTAAGGIKCWGWNIYGQLGDGTTTSRSTPADVSGLVSGVSAIAAGGNHTCALTASGRTKCWGWNRYGQLGDGTANGRHIPVNVSGLASRVSAIAAGFRHTCAVTASGGVRCWGRNNSGQLGDDRACGSRCPTPVQVVSFGRAQCVVPKLVGKKLAAAKRAIGKAHCAVGKVTKVSSKRVKKGRVISQKPKPSTTRPAAWQVALRVSKGPAT